jgi:hypothetical protein
MPLKKVQFPVNFYYGIIKNPDEPISQDEETCTESKLQQITIKNQIQAENAKLFHTPLQIVRRT